MQTRFAHRREVDRRLPVPELPHVEVVLLAVEALAALPAEEDVAGRVRDPLAADDPLAVVLELARAQVGLEHRRLRLLRLQHERVLAVAADEQEYPRARADAADAHDLAGHVDEPVGAEEVPPVRVEAGGVLVAAAPGCTRSRRELRPARTARGAAPTAAARCESAAPRRPAPSASRPRAGSSCAAPWRTASRTRSAPSRPAARRSARPARSR